MAGYFGTEQQQALQQRTYEMRAWIEATPGVYNAGRFIGFDDPDRHDPQLLEEMLARDGLLGFRMLTPHQAAARFGTLEAAGCRVDTWDVFVGDRCEAATEVRSITAWPLPSGLRLLPSPAGADSAGTVGLQRFLADNGLAPFPGSMLVSRPPRARTIVIAHDDEPAAAGHTYFPHNSHSRFGRHAWVGLVAVGERWRGAGLGRLVTAMLVQAAFEELGATHVYAMAGPANAASRRMIEGCGMRHDPELRSGVAVPAGAARFTR